MTEEQMTPAEPALAVPTPSLKAPLALTDADSAAYDAVQDGAAWFDLSPRHVSTFSGPKAADALNGLVTNDVLPLAVGRGLYAAALTPKGKVLADVVILRTAPETFVVETSEQAGAEWFAMVRKYVNPRLAHYRNDSAGFAALGVYGPTAGAVLAELAVVGGGDALVSDAVRQALGSWSEWSHAGWQVGESAVRVVRAPYLGAIAGFLLLVEPPAATALQERLSRLGAIAGSRAVWEMAALEGGRPVFGLDMDVTTIPQEANLDEWGAISYEKGCYTGQETVARLHFRGHVNRQLRGLRADAPLPQGAVIREQSGKPVGDVRRSGVSPRLGAMGIGMVRREVAVGGEVVVDGGGVVVAARVVALPEVDVAAGR